MVSRPTCEMCQSIDVRLLRRRNQLTPGLAFQLSWERDREQLGTISVRVDAGTVVLAFIVTDDEGGGSRAIEQQVPVVWTACTLGGGRPWFRCTAFSHEQYCGRRVAILYLGGIAGFACRRCYDLGYASQLESVRLRGLGRARKILMRLGGDFELTRSLPPRPKGMHEQTYNRLKRQYTAAAQRCGAF
ncbi:hypothetical protein RHPLAN_66380 [Rhodoplanes sp. Z2-YC6860]|nr:hypothetical protein RHPLAN_66380 [Rhodoplanes sp. Z2-YC6860]